jgi:hypothetical protein
VEQLVEAASEGGEKKSDEAACRQQAKKWNHNEQAVAASVLAEGRQLVRLLLDLAHSVACAVERRASEYRVSS